MRTIDDFDDVVRAARAVLRPARVGAAPRKPARPAVRPRPKRASTLAASKRIR